MPISEQIIETNEKGESVWWRKGKKYPEKEQCGLCRCGKSKEKPYCDGTHRTVGFDGTETAKRGKYLDMAETTSGPGLDLKDQKDLCSLARFCAAGKKTWHLVEETDKPKEKEVFLEQCKDCPSGRYTAWDKNKDKVMEPEFEPEIGVVQDPACEVSGPLWVRGGIPIESADGYEYEVRNRVALCRCGNSKNKPFCDGAHIATGFKDRE